MLQKEPLQSFGRNLFGDLLVVNTFAGDLQRLLVEVGGENLHLGR